MITFINTDGEISKGRELETWDDGDKIVRVRWGGKDWDVRVPASKIIK